MSILISVLLILEVVVAFLLIVVILAQKSKDQGLGMAFGGGMGESLFGSRAGNVLTRMTVTLSAVFMVNTILLGILFARGQVGDGTVMDRADREAPAPALPALPAPMAALPAASPMMMGGEAPGMIPAADLSPAMMLQMDESGELVAVPVEPVATADMPLALEEPATEPVEAVPAELPAEESMPEEIVPADPVVEDAVSEDAPSIEPAEPAEPADPEEVSQDG